MKLNTTNPVLQFQSGPEKFWKSLSAAVFVGDRLWLANDELTSVERLSTADGLTFKNHKSFPLEKLIRLPARDTDFDQEIDLEGMDHNDSYLWIIGSHSLKRKTVKAKDQESSEKKIRKLAKTEIAGNRFILARIPLIANAAGDQELAASANEAGTPSRLLKAAQLAGDVDSDLVTALRGTGPGHGDLHLERFLSIPGKDNGLDIEGLAVSGQRIFIGLRGPVLRGWAIILEVSVDFKEPATLSLRNIGPDVKPYMKHFLELGGLGIRDLCIDGSDLLILAGPTMNLDGPVAIYRWKNALESTEQQMVFSDELKQLLVVPNGLGADHAEGMTMVPGSQSPRQVLIVYDSPSEQRKAGSDAVRADVFDLRGL